MNKLLTGLTAVAFALGAATAMAQATAPATDADKAARPSGKEAMESQMNLQKNKPSKTVTEAEKKTAKNRPGGEAAMQSQMELQKNKPSKPVDKNAKAAPRPNASKMTPEERAD